jgi:hypothetical protein
MASYRIEYATRDGEVREETWSSLAAFLSWAGGEGLAVRYRAYQAVVDEEGGEEYILVEQGSIGGDGRPLAASPPRPSA